MLAQVRDTLVEQARAQGIAKEPPDAPLATPVVLVDGTGVGFNTPFYAQFPHYLTSAYKNGYTLYRYGGTHNGSTQRVYRGYP